MDLTSQPDREQLKVIDAEYSVESAGHKTNEAVVHLFCRDEDEQRRQVDVVGFRPYFYIAKDEFRRDINKVLNDRHVIGIEADLDYRNWEHLFSKEDYECLQYNSVQKFFTDDELSVLSDPSAGDVVAKRLSQEGNDVQVYHDSETSQSLHDEELVKVITIEPAHVGKIRDFFDQTWEADIPFPRRFLISAEVYRGIEIPSGASRVRYENWDGHSRSKERITELSPADPPDVEPRVLVTDIEVATHGGGVPPPGRAKNEITAITAYDSYTGEYAGWVLQSDEWDADTMDLPVDTDEDREVLSDEFKSAIDDSLGTDLDRMKVFDRETLLIEDFHQWVTGRDFDLVTGWNSNGFDYPYIIQRSYNISAYTIRDWAYENESPFNAGSDWPDPVIDGIVTFDMLDAYEKSQYRDLRSYSLEYVAQEELGYGKEDLDDDLDVAWQESPVEFMTYNVRDVQAVVEIEQASGLLSLYDNLREVTGALYNTCNHNGPMIDTLFLRRAFDGGIALPTNQSVPPEEGKYHGAKVFDPIPGVHETCVYPDLSSMYPNLFAMLNLGEETIIGNKADLESSEYTEADCFKFPIDEREFATVPKGETYDDVSRDEYKGVLSEDGGVREMFDPEYTDYYVLRPEVQESFVRSTIDDLIDLKYEYSGKQYEAVKRVTNSVYGVAGDSDSGGGKGFRLFNRLVAEGITLAGRLTIEFTAREFTEYIQDNYDDDAYLLAGDTDSSVTSIPNAESFLEALLWAEEASGHVRDRYDEFVQDQFALDVEQDDNRLDVEIESLASSLLYIQDLDADRPEQEAVKKRYAQNIIWEDDDGWVDTPDVDEYENAPDDPDDMSDVKHLMELTLSDYRDGVMADHDPTDHIKIKGFEFVRSDSATITKESQEFALTHALLAENPIDHIDPYLNELISDIKAGDVPAGDIGRPKGISKPLDEYGWKTVDELKADSNYTVKPTDEKNGGRYVSTPGPTYRGHKYAVDHIPWESLGNKPVRLYIEKVTENDQYPEVYTYDSFPEDDRPDPPEVGRRVDAIAVNDPSRLPDCFVLDIDKSIEKEIEDKINPILRTIGSSWDGVVGKGRQVGLDAF